MRVGYLAGLILLALLACAVGQSRLSSEKQTAWQPSPGQTQLPIWPGAAPDARPVEGPEVSGTAVDAAISNHFEKRLYPAVDAADKESCRPDFAVSLYPGHLAVPEKDFALNPDLQITSQTPPTFLLQAEDDPVDPVVCFCPVRVQHSPPLLVQLQILIYSFSYLLW